jgi:hypothetical protein
MLDPQPDHCVQKGNIMLSSVINSLRAFKGLYDVAFSEDQFYVEQRENSWEEFGTASIK